MTSPNKQLPANTILDNFRIKKTLGGGGFSIVYLAEEIDSGKEFVLKEYMPSRLAKRDTNETVMPRDDSTVLAFQKGRMMFFQEASTLATLQHNNIVNVRSFFRANNTVYMALYYEPGKELQQYIVKHQGGLSEKLILTIFPPIINALKIIHEHGYLHLDIKPGNIHIRSGGRPLLLDFGAVHQRQLSRQDQIGHITSQGFSPLEQYRKNGYMGPWTDIYSLGATIYACMNGRPAPPANERHDNDTIKPAVTAFRKQYTKSLLEAVDWALEVDPECRPQTLDAFLEALPALEDKHKSLSERLWEKITPGVTRAK
ncbi:MAG: serine/threonine protein kinase [Gammaproteobacteria bacterium]|nr:serine/threonine protein kinase [Gammaproteobacteria bacterium]